MQLCLAKAGSLKQLKTGRIMYIDMTSHYMCVITTKHSIWNDTAPGVVLAEGNHECWKRDLLYSTRQTFANHVRLALVGTRAVTDPPCSGETYPGNRLYQVNSHKKRCNYSLITRQLFAGCWNPSLSPIHSCGYCSKRASSVKKQSSLKQELVNNYMSAFLRTLSA